MRVELVGVMDLKAGTGLTCERPALRENDFLLGVRRG